MQAKLSAWAEDQNCLSRRASHLAAVSDTYKRPRFEAMGQSWCFCQLHLHVPMPFVVPLHDRDRGAGCAGKSGLSSNMAKAGHLGQQLPDLYTAEKEPLMVATFLNTIRKTAARFPKISRSCAHGHPLTCNRLSCVVLLSNLIQRRVTIQCQDNWHQKLFQN